MKSINKYRYFFTCFLIAIIPFIALSFDGIRGYVFDNFMVSAIYNSVIIAIYIMGSVCTLFTVFKNCDAREILTTNNANKKSSTLSSLNQVIFADDFMKCDSNLLIELDDSVSTARNQRLSFIMSCSNVSTLIGLLGTFAGLSITIGSIGNLLSTPSGVGGESSSNTLHMIVTMVASLSEPLKGMNTAFVSSIYGVVCAILLTSQSVFVRSSYALISAEIKRLKVKRSRASSNRQRSLRIESETLFEFKELFREFFDNYKSIELSRTQAEEKKLTVFSDGLSSLQNKLSDNTVILEQLSKQVDNYINISNKHYIQISDNMDNVAEHLSKGNALISENNVMLAQLNHTQDSIDKKNDTVIASLDKCHQESVSQRKTIDSIAIENVKVTHLVTEMKAAIDEDSNNIHSALSNLSAADEKIIDRTKMIGAEIVSYRETYIPLMEKITLMHQKLLKQSLLHDEVKNED
ncbi:hypothetical protein DUQ17_24570 [Salmonella enterica subsp. diarizonae]|nr:hypothetical protein [Salmonella enterica subsp. diarizonae]EEI3023771.1 hypothetical protein [Salmonella enterica subsp. diarizonae]